MSQQTSLPNQPNPVAASAAATALNVPPAGLAQAVGHDAIRPFRVDIPESEVAELKR